MKVITRCICAVWSLEQFLLCTVFAYLTYRIWKSVLHEHCRGFHHLSNDMNCFFIGLEDLNLWRIDCTAIFLLQRISDFLFLLMHMSLFGMTAGHDDGWLTQKKMQTILWCPLIHLFLRGVAMLKKLQDEGFIRSGASLGSISHTHQPTNYKSTIIGVYYITNNIIT